jgi:hypothetical protein
MWESVRKYNKTIRLFRKQNAGKCAKIQQNSKTSQKTKCSKMQQNPIPYRKQNVGEC